MEACTVGTLEDLSLVCIYRRSENQAVVVNDEEVGKVHSGALVEQWLEAVVSMLHLQWPRSTGVDYYKKEVVQSPGLVRVLPCSYVLVRGSDCLGHIRLSETFDSSSFGGSACAATFVLVAEAVRGQGLGRSIMGLAEKEAERLGYHYLYLWTKDAVEFYQRCGYTLSQRVALYRPCLRALAAQQVSGLEAMLAKKMSRGPAAFANVAMNAAEPAKENSAIAGNGDEVWLRKRLTEEIASEEITAEERVAELLGAIATLPAQENVVWKYSVLPVLWQRQVGPSCGLAALRMVRDYYLQRDFTNESGNVRHASLLAAALERGVTSDGEIYDLDDLLSLAQDICGLRGSSVDMAEITISDFIRMVFQKKLCLLSYDSDTGTKLPCMDNGIHSHAGVVVGVCWRVDRATNSSNVASDRVTSNTGSDIASAWLAEGDLDEAMQMQLSEDETLLIVQHSASKRWAVASIASFRASNGQLLTADSQRFVVKPLNLQGKALVFRGIAAMDVS